MPNTSTIDGIEGIQPRTTQMKNGVAMTIPTTLNNFLMTTNKGLRLFNIMFGLTLQLIDLLIILYTRRPGKWIPDEFIRMFNA